MFNLLARLVARVFDIAGEFLRGPTDKKVFEKHQEKNRLWIYCVAYIIPTFGLLISLGPRFDLGRLQIHKLNIPSPEFIQRLSMTWPFVLFTAFSAFSFWLLYSRYALSIHYKIIRPTRPFAALAIFLCFPLTIFVFGVYKPLNLGIFLLASAYGCALIFSLAVQGFITKNHEQFRKIKGKELDLNIIDELTLGWVVANLMTLVFLLILAFIVPDYDTVNNADVSVVTFRLTTAFLLLLTVAIITGGVRSRVYNNRKQYYKQVETLIAAREEIDRSQPGGPTGTPPNDGSNGLKLILFFLSIAKSGRFLGSIGGAGLVYLSVNSLDYALASFFFLAFSFLLNDAIDYEKDRRAHPNRPVARGLISCSQAFSAALLIQLIGVALAMRLPQSWCILLMGLFLASVLYSGILKPWIPAVATPIWSMMIALLVLFPLGHGFLEYLLVFGFFYGRELLLDYRDMKSDALFCMSKSLPCLLRRWTFLVVLLSVALSITAAILSRRFELALASLSALMILLALLLCRSELKSKRHDDAIFVSVVSHILCLYFPFVVLL